jgi:mutator protein MutT
VTVRQIVNALLLQDGMVLLAKRSERRLAYPGLWSFPGGHVEVGETYEQALSRELHEELGIVPVEFQSLVQIADPNVKASAITYHLYAVDRWDGTPRIMDDEHSELRWVGLGDARKMSGLALEAYREVFAGLLLRQTKGKGQT